MGHLRRVGVLLAGVVLILLFFTPPPVVAGSGFGSSYDWRSGNSYSWTRNSDGSTDVNGWNLRTGSSWRTTIEPDGDMRGTDSHGNSWTYDNSTGYYHNFGTGKTCFGKGALRTCY